MVSRTAAAVVLLALASTAHAAPEEIQVYMDEMNEPGHFGLDVHNNFVATGEVTNDYVGQQQSLHRYRVTPEFALGITSYLEFGLYLPLATIDRDLHPGIDGVKFRLKFIAPHAERNTWFWGANFEIGAVDHALDENPYNAEFKGILGIHTGPWIAALNANVDFNVAGTVNSPTTVEVDGKLSYAINRTLAVGVETYNGIGQISDLGHFGSSEQASFATVDLEYRGWNFNIGVGDGYGANPDGLVFKAIVGVPIN